jgi:hypothetical protein
MEARGGAEDWQEFLYSMANIDEVSIYIRQRKKQTTKREA